MLGNSSVQYLTAMLAHNGTLKTLSLANNSFTDGSAPLLAESMEVCEAVASEFNDKTDCF